ncbi:hypothetical protein TUSST3_42550 [Streptomyces sp. TUS-ST3]|nr:hypothetical protein TUSST3_42550 [Streptomyces sp. TUS-ST3]
MGYTRIGGQAPSWPWAGGGIVDGVESRPEKGLATAMRRSLTAATALTAVVLTAVLATGCDPDGVDDSLHCASNADAIADSLKALHEGDSLDTVEKNLDTIGDRASGDSDHEVEKAVKDLDQAVEDYNKAVLDGDTSPDASRIDAAAGRLKDLCGS